jgi:hypothetical protein
MSPKASTPQTFILTVVYPDGSQVGVFCEDYRQALEVIAAEAKTAEPMTMFIAKRGMSEKPFDRFGMSSGGDLVHHPYR